MEKTTIESLIRTVQALEASIKSVQWELKNLVESNNKNTNLLVTALDKLSDFRI